MDALEFIAWEQPNLSCFPTTRYHGSKRKLLRFLHAKLEPVRFSTALDLFSGSSMVSLLFRQMGKQASANDYLPYNQNTADLFLQTRYEDVPSATEARDELNALLDGELLGPPLVCDNFSGIYFTDPENEQIDRFCQNVQAVPLARRRLYIYAVGQALIMKRPFGLFHRANLNLRLAEVDRSFGNQATWDRPIIEHAVRAVSELRELTWGTPSLGTASCINTQDLTRFSSNFDLIYIDPPYISESLPVDYADIYHFLSGLVDYHAFAQPDRARRHAPILDLPSNWNHPDTALAEVSAYLKKWPASIIVFSYRSDGRPEHHQLVEVLSRQGRCCEVHALDFQYALAQQKTNELLLISRPALDELAA